MATDVKYPDVTVKLTSSHGDGNAFAVLAAVRRALIRHGVDADEIKAFTDEAMSGDYDTLLATCMRWVEVT